MGDVDNLEAGMEALAQPTVICTDGSGGEYSADPRYRRCGWSWAAVEFSMGRPRVAAAKRGPLPGPRQSNNRAELYAVYSAISSTVGPLEMWTDSEIAIKGWRRRRFNAKGYEGSNSDIWAKIGGALRERPGGADAVQLHHIESHLTESQATRKGYPLAAWVGNQEADRLAGLAAEEHALPAAQISCFEWMRATAALVRKRIIQANLEATELQATLTMSEKEEKKQLLESTGHDLRHENTLGLQAVQPVSK